MENDPRDIVGVILAGGQGVRMTPLSHRVPKPLLPVCNKRLIVYHLEAMRAVGIVRVFIVVGHLGELIRDAIGPGHDLGLEITYVQQESRLGIAHALGLLEPHIRSPFLLFLADIFFRPSGLERLVSESRAARRGSHLVVRRDNFEALRKNFAVLIEAPTRRVTRVIEKPQSDPGPDRLKGCGLYLLDLPIFAAIRRTPRSTVRNEYEITDAIQILIDSGERVETAEVVEEDVNISTPADLLRCNLEELDRLGVANLIGPEAVIAPTAHLRRCIIGAGARIGGKVNLEDCLVFPSVTIGDPQRPLRNHIVTAEVYIDCNPP